MTPDHIRKLIRDQGATPNIPPNSAALETLLQHAPLQHNLIERFFSKPKHFRRALPATTSSPPTSLP